MNLYPSYDICDGAMLRPLSPSCGLPSTSRAEVLSAMATLIPPPILKLAECIEPNLSEMLRWFEEDSISTLGGRTAKDSVASAEDRAVVNFLGAVKRDKR